MQNCETRLSSLFLGHGDHFWQSYDENSLIFIFIYTSYAKRRGVGFTHVRNPAGLIYSVVKTKCNTGGGVIRKGGREPPKRVRPSYRYSSQVLGQVQKE